MRRESCKIKISLCIILFVNCSLWLFDGIIGWKKITFLTLLFGMFIMCTKKIEISKMSIVWLLYLIPIMLSLVINNALSSWIIYYFCVYSVVICCSLLIDCDLSVFRTCIIFLVGIGIFNALTVIVQFFLKDQFNELYYPFLKFHNSLNTATFYYERGYYSGINFKPHETAGVIAFAMAALFIWGMVQTEYKKKYVYIAVACLFVPLLLTGKKGVFACMVAVFMLMILLWYASQRKWMRIAMTIGGAVVLLIVVVSYIITHLDNPLFYRFATFFSNLSSGESVDSGRGKLWEAAWQVWKENKLFGIGWYQFNGLTVSRFDFSRSHSVNLDYLQFLCETGVLGFALMMTPIIVMARRTVLVWKNVLTTVMEKREQWIILFAVFVQIFTILYAFIEVPFYNFMYFTIYMFSCMIINNAYKQSGGVTLVEKTLTRLKVVNRNK